MEDFNWGTFVLYAFVGWFILRILQNYLIRKNDEMQQDIEFVRKKIKDTIVIISVEKHGDIYYAFDKETDTFIAQGKDGKEMKEAMTKRFPNKTFLTNEQHMKELGLDL